METRCGGLLFTSKFDSGNLARVEKVGKDEDEGDSAVNHVYTGGEIKPDYEFNCWTKPDMGGTQFENGNRSWFYFGVKGGGGGRLIKINIVNMNRQGKLYNQGHSPIVKTVPGKTKWDRIRDRPTYETVDGQFILSFTHRFLDVKGATTYFAFCYPWTYAESQNQMALLDAKFEACKTYNSQTPPDKIYYHRELLCESLDRLRVDLLTITDCHGMAQHDEPHFDTNLFPERAPRCKAFPNKRVYLVSSRVHPGETPASHVYNGVLELLLREDDPRARQLRRQYVFKLIPMLNPDGVVRGHYRTDSRGVNLNRMYLDPDFSLYPSIYASKALLVFHHVHNRVPDTPPTSRPPTSAASTHGSAASVKSNATATTPTERSAGGSAGGRGGGRGGRDKQRGGGSAMQRGGAEDRGEDRITQPMSCLSLASESLYAETEGGQSGTEAAASGGECQDSEDDVASKVAMAKSGIGVGVGVGRIGNEGSDDDDLDENHGKGVTTHYHQPSGLTSSSSQFLAPHLSDPKLREIPHDRSGIAMYVDLHAHASKRGCFIYGNYYEDEETQAQNMLFSKLCSINTAHFDFTACNFTERNMYLKDKREGLSKEGAGRVALYKALGIIHSYTLECNYNTGRMVNSVPTAYNDCGRATPPPLAGFPPKYRPEHYEDVGRALLVSMLDLTESNPWSRVTLSEHCSLHGVKEYVRRFIRGLRGLPKGAPNRPQRAAMKAAAAAAASVQQPMAARGSIASNSPLKSSSMTSTKATPIPRVATLSRSSTSTGAGARGGGAGAGAVHRTASLSGPGGTGTVPARGTAARGVQATQNPGASGGAGARGPGRTTPQAWGRGRELPSVKEGLARSVPGRRHTATSLSSQTAPPANKPVHHSMSAPVPLTLTTSTDIKCLSGDGPCKPPSTPPVEHPSTSRRPSLDADSIHSMEEEKVQQLKNLPGYSRGNAIARTAKPLEPPNIQIEFGIGESKDDDDRSDPVKRKNKRGGGGGGGGGAGSKIRRSSSHSPKSAKAGAPRKLGTLAGGVGGEGAIEYKAPSMKGRRRKSMAGRKLRSTQQHQQQQAQQHPGNEDSSAEADAGGPDMTSSAVRITPRIGTPPQARGAGGSSVAGFLNDGPPPPLIPPTPPPASRSTRHRHKAPSHKRGSRAALEMKRDIERITARLAEQRIQRVLMEHATPTTPPQTFWIDY